MSNADTEKLSAILPDLICICCQLPPRPSGPEKDRYFCGKCSRAFCGSCHQKLQINPRCGCGGVLSETIIQPFARLLQDLPFACQNYSHGCREIKTKEDLEAHEIKCQFRLIHCADFFCREMVTYSKYMDHASSRHSMASFLDIDSKGLSSQFVHQSSSIGTGTCWHLESIIRKEGQNFFLIGCVENEVVLWWLYHYGLPEETKKYTYTFSVSKGSRKISFEDSVWSMTKAKDWIIKKRAGFTMPVSLAEEMKDNDGKIHFKLNIFQVKPDDKGYDSGLSCDEP